jgi:hypothetical protein
LGYVQSGQEPMMFIGTRVDETNVGFTDAEMDAAVGDSQFDRLRIDQLTN